MTLQWKTSLQAGLCAAAVLGTGWVQAQTPQHNQSHGQAMPAHSAPSPTMQRHQGDDHHQRSKKAHSPAHKASSGKYATPHQHEAAAVGHERRQGNMDRSDQMTDLQRNALRRCEIFKTNDDRMACVERVRQPQISGSVEGGGVIREYTQTIRVDNPAMPSAPTVRPVQPGSQPGSQYQMPHPAQQQQYQTPQSGTQYQTPQPNPHPHLVHPQVQPIRPQ